MSPSSLRCRSKKGDFIKAHCLRLLPGQDLKEEIINLCESQNITAGYIASAVGSLEKINLRLAGADQFLKRADKYEILSVNGTVSTNGLHLHLSAADRLGHTFGGHLMNENIIFTTCELIILELRSFNFTRDLDLSTGFKEIKIST